MPKCPLIKDECMEDECKWWVPVEDDQHDCAMIEALNLLDALLPDEDE